MQLKPLYLIKKENLVIYETFTEHIARGYMARWGKKKGLSLSKVMKRVSTTKKVGSRTYN